MGHENNGLQLSPKQSFLLGLAGGVLVLCTLGFFILLGMMLNGGLEGSKAKKTSPTPTAAAPTAAAPTAAPPTDGSVGPFRPVDETDHVRGAEDPDVVMIEYSDFECPFCGRFHPSMLALMDEYGDRVQWVYRHFPLSFHPQAAPAANASECAAAQGEFWEFADALFENQTMLSNAYYTQLAGEIGLDVNEFQDCFDSREYSAKVNGDLTDGSTAGVTGTPGTIIIASDGSSQIIPGAIPYEQLRGIVESAL